MIARGVSVSEVSDLVRIGLICPYSLTVPGGVQAQVIGLAKEFRRRGLEARVLGPCDGPPPESFVQPLGNSIPTAANGSIAPLAPDPSAVFRTVRALRDEAFDVIHIHEPIAPGPTMTALLLHVAPTVGTFHAAGTSASYRYMNYPMRRTAPRLDVRVAVSNDARDLIQRYVPGEYVVLFNGVDVEGIQAARPYPTEGPTIFFCGRHEERKGLRVLLDAFDGLDVPARLWIASNGPDTNELMARTRGDDRVEWLGRISEEDKLARLRGATVFCAPSLGGESFGVVLIEAMAAGITVVASSLDGYRNVATSEVDSLLVPPGDPGLLRAALERALAGGPDIEAMRAAGLERANDFSMPALADRYLGIYDSIIRRP